MCNCPKNNTLPGFTRGNLELKYKVRLKTYQVTECPAPFTEESACSPDEARRLGWSIWDQSDNDRHVEMVLAVAVDARNHPTACALWTGSVDHSVVYPRRVLELCLRAGASGLILFHNHPSGDMNPSAQDLNLTKNLEIAARALGVRFLDHIILNNQDRQQFFSFQRTGLLS